jgi:hypothetical protein
MNSETMLTIFVIVVALGLVAVQVISIVQEANARGCPVSTVGINASKGRCFGH